MDSFANLLKGYGLVLISKGVEEKEVYNIAKWIEKEELEDKPLETILESDAYLKIENKNLFGERFSMPGSYYSVAPIGKVIMVNWDYFENKITIRSLIGKKNLIEWIKKDIEENKEEYKEMHGPEIFERLFNKESAEKKIMSKLAEAAKEINRSKFVREKLDAFSSMLLERYEAETK